MTDRQKYSLRIAMTPTNAIEGVTYMDLKAVQAEIKRAIGDYEYASFDCVNEDDTMVNVLIKAADIQMVMHNVWRKPVASQIAVPGIAMPPGAGPRRVQ